jgi:5-methyltetrahydropteroyltriglutamate--homocysteine methyltransferase
MVMDTLIDDIGSFPFPPNTNREAFNRGYRQARELITKGEDPTKDDFVKNNFCDITIDIFKRKLSSGLDVATHPQQYEGTREISDAIHKAMEKGTFIVEEKDAFLPEVALICQEGKALSEEFGKKILLRVSLFGPMEQYLKEIGTAPYPDVLDGFAETVRRFAKNCIVDTKHVKTEVISIDEPSFGYLNIAASSESINSIMDKAFNFKGATRQIHLHSSARLPDLLNTKNIDVLSFEYAASPKNIESISKRMLDTADKQVRVGIARTDIDAILAELHDQGIAKPTPEQMVESEQTIRKRYLTAKEKYGDRMTFTGPDCGLRSWPTQEAAQLLLEKTVNAVKAI